MMHKFTKKIKKVIGVTLAFAMVFTTIPVSAAGLEKSDNHVVKVSESGAITAEYLDNGIIRTQDGCKEFSDNMSDGWYVLTGKKVASNAVVISGKVNLILADDSYLEANDGIYIKEGSELIIWSQSNYSIGNLAGGTGTIKAKTEDGAGIGSVRETMGGSLTINGGIIEAVGSKYSAGIGGGKGEASGFGNVTINNGYVSAIGGDCGAGIGRGHQNWRMGVVTINGGDVNAKCSDDWAAGIGGSVDRSGTTVVINGGKVTATGGHHAAGIGGGIGGHQGEKVTINGGEVTTTGGYDAAGIGGGGEARGTFKSSSGLDGGEVEINGGTVKAYSKGFYAAAIGGGQHGKNGPITINGGNVLAESLESGESTGGCAIGSSQYQDQGGPITINGGDVMAISHDKGAAIGGGRNGGVVNINGGRVKAESKKGAGIGGCEQGIGEASKGGNGGNVTITGGEVIAVSNGKSAGIGGGIKGSGGTLTVTGGKVSAGSGVGENGLLLKTSFGASGPSMEAAIGSAATTFVAVFISLIVYGITSGEVGGAGIGGGYKGDGGTVKITGGTVAAASKLLDCPAIGKGYKGNNDGTLEIYDEASVSASNDKNNLKQIEKDDRVSACRKNTNAIIQKCDHTNTLLHDEDATTHIIVCPYCKTTGKTLVEQHHFDEQIHKCSCGHWQFKAVLNVENINLSKDEATSNIKILTSDKESNKYTNYTQGGYISKGDSVYVVMSNNNCMQEVTMTYDYFGHTETLFPVEYKTSDDGKLMVKFIMPNADIDINCKVTRNEPNYKVAQVTSAPAPIKGKVYDGGKQMIVVPGSCKNGTMYYALGKDDVNPPEFDGNEDDIYGNNESDRTWKHKVPMVVDPGLYYVWYMVRGDEGYIDSKPACVMGLITKVMSDNASEVTIPGEIQDISKKNSAYKSSKNKYKSSIELYKDQYNGEIKFDIEVNGKNVDSAKIGDVLDVAKGDKVKIDIPSDVTATSKGVQVFYKKKDNVTYTLAPKVAKLNDDGSYHTEYEMPEYDSRIVIQLEGDNTKSKQVTYEAPTPRTGLVCNNKNQALVKRGSATGGKMYYAIGDNNVTAPEFDALSDKENKTWSIATPQASESGKYYVWYMVKGNDGYEDVSPKCVEAEIGKSPAQKKADFDDDTDGEEEKQPVVKTTDNKLPSAVETTSEEKDKGVNIWMEEEDITDSLDDYSKSILNERFSDYEIPMVIDLSVYKKVGDEEPVDITDLMEDVELSVDVPNKYVKEGRNFVILRFNEDDPTDITVINPKEFDTTHNELIFETSKICPFAIAYKADEVVDEEQPVTMKTPSLISPKAKEGLYYSGKNMELVTEGSVVGGTIYYTLGEDSVTAPEFDGTNDNTNKKWTTTVPKAKEVGKYNVWYKVIGDEGYTDLDESCIVSEIKEVPSSKYDDIQKEKGKTVDVTDHPSVVDNNPHKVKIDTVIKPTVPAKPVVDNKDDYNDDDDDYDDDYYDDDDEFDYDDDEGINYWIEANDITDTLTEDDVRTVYKQLRKYYIGRLIDLTLIMQVGDETIDVAGGIEPTTISFEVPEELVKSGRKYIIYMLEDDGDFENPTVIKPTNFDETSRRLSFETDRIKPFILGYTDDPNENDLVVFEEDYEVGTLSAKSTVYNDNDENTPMKKSTTQTTEQTTPQNTPQTDGVPSVNNDNTLLAVKETFMSGGSKVNVKSAKTGDDDIVIVITRFIYNVASCIK